MVSMATAAFNNSHHDFILSRVWPQPVMLKLIEDGPLHVRVWNPKVCPVHNLSCTY